MFVGKTLVICMMQKLDLSKIQYFFQLLATNIESNYLTFLSTKEPAILLFGALQIEDFFI